MIATSRIIDECEKVILEHLFDRLGKKSIVAVILTGSAARSQATYRSVNGKLLLESDLDFVLVVNRASVIKSLRLIKRLSGELTHELRKEWILSHVSLSVITENALLHAGPSIFYQDLSMNGKVIFGKKYVLTPYNVGKIPDYDIYRLLFNRMIEALEALVLNREMPDAQLVTRSVRKMIFAMIEAMLIKHDILVFNGHNLDELEIKIQRYQKGNPLLSDLLKTYEELSLNNSVDLDEKYWLKTIDHFKRTIERLSNRELAQSSIRSLFANNEGLTGKSKTSLVIFLQYFGTYKLSDLARAALYITRFGSDQIYTDMYQLLTSSMFLLESANVKEPRAGQDNALIEKSWLQSFHKCLKIWKLRTGG